ncbi:MAG: TRAP transporter large permease [Polaromonas sp.]|nr:TRAP transporter large permease [Polaromonas sp.]
MSAITLAFAIFGIMLVFMAIRVPIAVAMFAAGSIGYVMQTGWGPFSSFLNTQAFARFASYDLSVIPLFILMGHFATQGGISKSLFSFAAGVMGRFKGGLATGTLAAGTLAAGGTLGILIPPSVPLVIYAILTEQNIAKLFAAAMVPGVIAMLGYMAAIAIYVRLVPGQAPDIDDHRPALTRRSFLGILPIGIIFLLVFGGIYGGWFTPTEGAAVGAAATFVTTLLRREMTWAKFKLCFYATAESSAMIFLIFIGADLMNSALALTQIPSQLASVVGNWGLSPLMVVTAILLFYVVLGAVMDELSMLLLTIPIFFPMVIGLDFGMPRESVATWFGIMVLMTVGFGLLAPPVGLNVYVVNGLAKDVPLSESYKGVMPFLISDTLRTTLLLLFPGISLWLVKYIA